jgi:hypothetical protein
MIWLSDVKNNHKVAVNPSNVVAVFTAPDGEFEGKTVVSLVSGTLVVNETDLDVVSMVEGAK